MKHFVFMSQLVSNTIPKVLLVEDDQPLREVLGEILRKEGYVVDEAISGEQALLMARKNNYQVVLLDLLFKTTGLQGLAVLKRLQLSFPNLPVIILSGKASDETVVQTIREGGFSFITKPIHDLQNVLLLLKKAMEPRPIGDFSTQLQSLEILLKGAPVDIHAYIYAYLEQFSTYLKLVKGVQSAVSLESNFDDIHFFVHAEQPKQTLLFWFKEFLGFSENGISASLKFATILSWDEQQSYLIQLNQSIRILREQVAKALRRYYIDPSFGHDLTPYLVQINPIKLINQIGLEQVCTQSDSSSSSYYSLSEGINQLLSSQKTLTALNHLLLFTERESLYTAFDQAKELQARYESAVNLRMSGASNEEELERVLGQIQREIREELLPSIKQLLPSKRA
jgi:DNA-binding response OmpR family regulator